MSAPPQGDNLGAEFQSPARTGPLTARAMPIDESGCVVVLLRAIGHIIVETAEWLPWEWLVDLIRWLGRTLVWIATLGRYRPSHEDWLSLVVGLVVLVTAIALAVAASLD